MSNSHEDLTPLGADLDKHDDEHAHSHAHIHNHGNGHIIQPEDAFQDHRRHSSLRPTGVRRPRSLSTVSGEAAPAVLPPAIDVTGSGPNPRRPTISLPLRRRRASSRSSHHGAVFSSGDSIITKKTSRSHEHEGHSDESIGDTDDDVCFPHEFDGETDAAGVNIGELDQLLGLVDSEEGPNSDSTAFPVFSPEIEPSINQLKDTEKEYQSTPSSETTNGGEVSGSNGDTAVTQTEYDPELVKSPGLKIPFIPMRHTRSRQEEVPDLQLPDSYAEPEFGDGARSRMTFEGDDDEDRFSFFASGLESTVHAPDLASLVGEGESFASLFDKKNGVWWLNCYNPSDQEMKVLARAFGIHPLTAEDIRTEESREKFEMFKKYYFVSFHTFDRNPANEDTYLEPVNFYMIVFTDGVLSFHFTPVSHTRNVRRRMRQLRDYVTVTSDWICYALIDDITDSFAPVIHQVEAEADYIEDNVYVRNSSDNMSSFLLRLTEARKKTMRMIRLLTGKADVIRGFSKRCNEHWANMPGSEIALYLGDIQDHLVTMYQNLTAYEKILSRSHVNYMAQLQMEFVNSNNRMTTVLGKATMIGTVLIPMNLITGLFGMNVRIPGQDGSNLGWFFGILGVMILMVAVLGSGANYWINRMTHY